MPVALDKSGNQQQKRALRLVEVGYQYIYHLERIARYNDYPGA